MGLRTSRWVSAHSRLHKPMQPLRCCKLQTALRPCQGKVLPDGRERRSVARLAAEVITMPTWEGAQTSIKTFAPLAASPDVSLQLPSPISCNLSPSPVAPAVWSHLVLPHLPYPCPF